MAGALSALAPRFFPPVGVRAFLLVGTMQTCCFSEAFERAGASIQHWSDDKGNTKKDERPK